MHSIALGKDAGKGSAQTGADKVKDIRNLGHEPRASENNACAFGGDSKRIRRAWPHGVRPGYSGKNSATGAPNGLGNGAAQRCRLPWRRSGFCRGTSEGTGGSSGNASAAAFTQLIAVRWHTPKMRAIRRKFVPSTYIYTACLRICSGYPCGRGPGVYRRPHTLHR